MTSGTIEERFDASMKEKTELSNLGMTSAEDWITSYSAFGSLLLSSGAYFCLVELIAVNKAVARRPHETAQQPKATATAQSGGPGQVMSLESAEDMGKD